MKKAKVIARHACGETHEVVTRQGSGTYRREPCEECPWRTDRPTGVFPSEAFRASANTAYDASTHMFACHMAGGDRPQTCAGFILRNGENNLGLRISAMAGRIVPARVSSKVPLYGSYREMAVANGVDPQDPALAPCRANDEREK